MPPFEGFDCTTGSTKAGQTAEPELNNNVLLLDNSAARKEEVAAGDEDDDLVVDDKGQRLVDEPIAAAVQIDKEAQRRERRGRQFVWHNIVLITVFHALAVWATWNYVLDLGLASWIYSISLGGIGGLGVTAGCHRLWSHRSYKASKPLRYFLALCYSVAGQNTILEWVRDHRVHHKFTETDADPHNVKRGFFFAHVGWLMQRKHPDVLRQGKKVDLSDVQADPVVQWHQRHFITLKILLCFLLPPLIPVYGWGESWHLAIYSTSVVRYVLLLNFTWLVNSAAHMFGNKPFDSRINPTENVLVSAVALGEGWHNYHHVFPWDYKTSEYSYFFNATTFWIDIFSALGLAYDRKTATPDMVRRVALRHGDNSHPDHKRVENDHHHPEEVTYDEYLRVIKEDDAYTGVKDLHNEDDPTRMDKSKS